MTWSKFDDGSRKHPKAVRAGNEAWSFWSGAVQYSNQHLTDGFIPEGALATEILPVPIPPKRAKVLAMLLVEAKLRPEGAGLFEIVDGGYLVHDFLDWNPSKAEVEEKRRKDRDRKRGGGGEEPPSNPRGSPSGNPRGSPPGFRAEGHEDSELDSERRAGPRAPPRGRPAQPARPIPPVPTDPGPDRSLKPQPKALSGSAREDTSSGGGGTDRIRCPVPIPVPQDSLTSLEIAVGIPKPVALKAILDFSLAWNAKETDQRFHEAWVGSVVKALTGDWSDPAKRARMRAAAEEQGPDEATLEAEAAARRARHDERIRQKNEAANAMLAKTGGLPPGLDPRKLVDGIGS